MFAKSAFTLAVAAIALLASSVAAQTNTSSIDPSSIPPTTRDSWCNAQFNTCKILCNQDPSANSCNDTTLAYTCNCASNNSAPGLAYYTQTIPTFLCEQVYQNCIAANTQNSTAQAECKSTEQADCGQLDPTTGAAVSTTGGSSASTTAAPTTSSGSSGSSGSSSSAASTTSAPSSSSVSSSSSAAAAATMLALGRDYGSGILAAGFAVVVML